MFVVSVSEEEDRLFEGGDFVVHFVSLDVRLEHGEVVDCTFAVGGGDDIVWVEAKVDGYFPPGCLYGGDGVGQGAVLQSKSIMSGMRRIRIRLGKTNHVEEDGISSERRRVRMHGSRLSYQEEEDV